MDGLKLLIAIVRRDLGESYIHYFRHAGIPLVTETIVSGTAGKNILGYLGLENTEKVMLLSFVPSGQAPRLLRLLIHDMKIDLPGSGIACTIPTDKIGGLSSLRYFTGKSEVGKSEVESMSVFPYALIFAVVENGTTELVMNAARSAGAGGGTVLHAKVAGSNEHTKFFGMSIAEEREIVQIVARSEDKDAIMRAIMEHAGASTSAHAAVFSLPVEDVVGLRSVKEDYII